MARFDHSAANREEDAVARRRSSLVMLPVTALLVAACAQPTTTEAGGPVQLVHPGELTTCTHLPYEPFQFPQGGRTVGFDVDLVDLVARNLGVRQNIVDTPFEGIQSGESLNSGLCDVAAAAMTINDVRKRNMDFSDPYFDAEQALLVRRGAGHRDLAALRGKRLGVQLGTTGEEYAKKNAAAFGYQIVQFEDLALEETAVQTGQVDAAVNDNGVLYHFARQHPETEVTAEFPTGDRYGIGIRKGNAALLRKVDDVLGEAHRSGEYDRIYEKWFGRKPR